MTTARAFPWLMLTIARLIALYSLSENRVPDLGSCGGGGMMYRIMGCSVTTLIEMVNTQKLETYANF